ASYGGGALTGTFSQNAGPTTVTATNQFEGPNAQMGGINNATQAVANSQSIAVVGGSADVAIRQTSQALTQA
ncbi:hypothetical protein, partial [Acinetobacter pittii]